MRQSKFSNLLNFVRSRIETYNDLMSRWMQLKNCMRVAIIFCNLALCWKQAKTEINELSETSYSYFALKVITCNCVNLVWFCLKFLHVLV